VHLITLRAGLLLAAAAAFVTIVATVTADGRRIDARSDTAAPSAPAPPQLAPLQALPPVQVAWQAPGSTRKTAKLNPHLDLLYRIDILARQAGRRIDASNAYTLPESVRGAVEQGEIYLDDAGRVQVFVDVFADAPLVADALRGGGMEVQRVSDAYGIVQGMLPVSQLEAVAALPGVRMVRPPERPQRAAGSVQSEGDAILDADALRTAYGVNGAGVRVGVISDGLEGMAAAQASGDLSAVNSTTCDMIESAPAGEPADPTAAGAGAEGTAMLEIVHDLAPGAELWFGYFGFNVSTATLLDFMDAVDCLAANVDVVVDDIAFFAIGPYDGTSSVSQNASTELNRATNRVRGHYNAVENQALTHYQESYIDSNPADTANNLHLFQSTGATTDAFAIGSANFDPVFLGTGGMIVVFLAWDDPFGASANDYDLYLGRDSDGLIVTGSEGEQSGTQDPVEVLVYTNPGAAGYFDILINKWAGLARTFDMFISTCDCAALPNGAIHNYNTLSSSVPNNSDAGGGVVSLGAINASEPDAIAPYSSHGPTNDGRIKPDAVAIDGMNITGSGGFPSPFYGTSAAAPHAGAIAALILSCKPSLKHGEPGDSPSTDRTALRNALLNTSVDFGTPGQDNTFGSGRLDADAAAANAGCGDRDDDAVPNTSDNCVSVPNPDQADGDADDLGDACEADYGTDPTVADTDGDGCRDGKEVTYPSLSPVDPWDFYSVPVPALRLIADPLVAQATFKDGVIVPQDAQAVFRYFGFDAGSTVYEQDLNQNGVKDGWEYDRTTTIPPSAPDGIIVPQDAQRAFSQFGMDCT